MDTLVVPGRPNYWPFLAILGVGAAGLLGWWGWRKTSLLTPAAAASPAALAVGRPEDLQARRDRLGYRGLTDYNWQAADLDALDTLQRRVGWPLGTILAVLNHESRLNPRARNPPDRNAPTFAAGLCQLTRQANLPGYTSVAALDRFLEASIAEQLDVCGRLWERMPKTYFGGPMPPGRALMLNFLPSFWQKEAGFVLGRRGDASTLPGSRLSLGAVYRQNTGFARGRDYFTVGDVLRSAERRS